MKNSNSWGSSVDDNKIAQTLEYITEGLSSYEISYILSLKATAVRKIGKEFFGSRAFEQSEAQAVSNLQKNIISLWGKGYDDEMIATQLGISLDSISLLTKESNLPPVERLNTKGFFCDSDSSVIELTNNTKNNDLTIETQNSTSIKVNMNNIEISYSVSGDIEYSVVRLLKLLKQEKL